MRSTVVGIIWPGVSWRKLAVGGLQQEAAEHVDRQMRAAQHGHRHCRLDRRGGGREREVLQHNEIVDFRDGAGGCDHGGQQRLVVTCPAAPDGTEDGGAGDTGFRWVVRAARSRLAR